MSVSIHSLNAFFQPGISQLECIMFSSNVGAQVFLTAEALAQQLGKVVTRSEDRPGFIINRVLMPMINEAFFALMEVWAAENFWSLPPGLCLELRGLFTCLLTT